MLLLVTAKVLDYLERHWKMAKNSYGQKLQRRKGIATQVILILVHVWASKHQDPMS